MAIPPPEIGLVIGFNYLWRREQDMGRDNARYPRPCVIVLAHRQKSDGAVIVLVVPVTHSAPSEGTDAIEMPAPVKQHLKLDKARSWIVVDEVNEFAWPGFDLQPKLDGTIAYGLIPSRLYDQVRQKVRMNALSGRLRRVPR